MLQDKVILVTGTASGIGRASAKLFTKEGAKVVTGDLEPKGGEATLADIKAGGGDGIFVETDVSKENQVKRLVESGVEAFGRLDGAFNCAGYDTSAYPTVEVPDEMWEKAINTNLKGTWMLMKYEIPEMLKVGKGAIVNMGSVCSVVALKDFSAYGASRFGIVGLSKNTAIEYARQGIRVNVVGPAAVNTPIFQRLTGGDPAVKAQFEDMHPIGRICEPEDIAEGALWLLSDRSAMVVGHLLMVDGGFTSM
jgi:NAD(P)-dependent dehydrogenase (short-subunit alcohol dehydrogenase family)